jgi:hypothetical protein
MIKLRRRTVGKRASSTNNGSAASSSSRFKLVVPLALVTLSLTTASTAHQQQQLQNEQQHSSSDISVFVAEMRSLLGEENVETDLQELMQRGKPWNSYHKIDNHPGVIVFPQSTEDVSAILKACSKHGVRVVPFGGGTSIEGQTLAMEGGCSLDFNRMKSVLELNEGDLDVCVQAGLGYLELNELLREKGLWFPLDPGPGASIGGM